MVDSFGSKGSVPGGPDPRTAQRLGTTARAGTLEGGDAGLSAVPETAEDAMSRERPLPSDAANHEPRATSAPGPTPAPADRGWANYPTLPVMTGSGAITPVAGGPVATAKPINP
jgi:hypothetical protein